MNTVAVRNLPTTDEAALRAMVKLVAAVSGRGWNVRRASPTDGADVAVTVLPDTAANSDLDSKVATMGREGAHRFVKFAGRRFDLRTAPFAEFLECVAGADGADGAEGMQGKVAARPLLEPESLSQLLQLAVANPAYANAVLVFTPRHGDAGLKLVVWPGAQRYVCNRPMKTLLAAAHHQFSASVQPASSYAAEMAAPQMVCPLSQLTWALYWMLGGGALLAPIAGAKSFRLSRMPATEHAANRLMMARMSSRLSAAPATAEELAEAAQGKLADAANFINAAWLSGCITVHAVNAPRLQPMGAALRPLPMPSSRPKRTLVHRLQWLAGMRQD
jgi:hypothetical protein